MLITAYERFGIKYDIDPISGCWIWNSGLDNDGYGQFYYKTTQRAHRFIYEYTYGIIPNKLTVHHKCNIRACVNPAHLELRTIKDNVLANNGASAINAHKTHCIRGHEFSIENTYINTSGSRECKVCRRIRKQKSRSNYFLA